MPPPVILHRKITSVSFLSLVRSSQAICGGEGMPSPYDTNI